MNAKELMVKQNPEKLELSSDKRYVRIKNIKISYNDFCRLFDKNEEHGEIAGYVVKLSGLRLSTFRKNNTCPTCGLVGTHFYLELNSPKDGSPHLNLYGVNKDGEEIIFTKDHIKLKSKGGADHLSNLQTMCGDCNFEKADKYV